MDLNYRTVVMADVRLSLRNIAEIEGRLRRWRNCRWLSLALGLPEERVRYSVIK